MGKDNLVRLMRWDEAYTKAEADKIFSRLNEQNTFNQESIFNDTVIFNGNIIQRGETYKTHAEDIYTKKDIIHTRDGATTGLGNGEYTGIEAEKYDGVNNGQLVFDNKGVARVGDKGDLQALLTRDEETNLSDEDLFYWDAANEIARGISINELLSKGISNKLIKVIDSESIRICELDSGIYYIPINTIIYYSGKTNTNNKLQLTADSYMIISKSNNFLDTRGVVYGFFIFYSNAVNQDVYYGYSYDGSFSSYNTGIVSSLRLSNIAIKNVANTWTGVQTFQATPKITVDIDDDDNSQNIPTTKWVGDHLSKKSNKSLLVTSSNEICIMTYNKEIRYGSVSSLTIKLPEEIEEDYISCVIFTSDISDSSNFNYPLTVQMSGDDCTDKVFSPVAGKRYTILLYNDGVNINGVVNSSEVI